MTLPPLVAGLGFLALIWNVIMFFMFNEAHEHGQEKEISFCHPSRFRRKMIEVSSLSLFADEQRGADEDVLVGR